jgi:hypothetical protein
VVLSPRGHGSEQLNRDEPGALALPLARAVRAYISGFVDGTWPRPAPSFARVAETYDKRLYNPDLDKHSEMWQIWMFADEYGDEEDEAMPDLDHARHERNRVMLLEWANAVLRDSGGA